jgi:hypothetical protein
VCPNAFDSLVSACGGASAAERPPMRLSDDARDARKNDTMKAQFRRAVNRESISRRGGKAISLDARSPRARRRRAPPSKRGPGKRSGASTVRCIGAMHRRAHRACRIADLPSPTDLRTFGEVRGG